VSSGNAKPKTTPRHIKKIRIRSSPQRCNRKKV